MHIIHNDCRIARMMRKVRTSLTQFCLRMGEALPTDPEGITSACIALLLTACYLAILPIGQTIALRNLFFYSLLLVTMWSVWRYHLHLRLPLKGPWMGYGIVSLLSLTYAMDPLWSLGEIKKEVGYGILALMLTATWVRNILTLERLLIAIIAGNILLVASVLFKITVLNPFWEIPVQRISFLLYMGAGKEIYGGVGNYSTYLVTVFPIITVFALQLPPRQRLWRNALFALLALDLLELFLTTNRMGLLALIAEVIFAVGILVTLQRNFPSRQTLVTVAFILLTLGALSVLTMHARSPEGDIREHMWRWAISDIAAAPFTGSGFGRTVMPIYDPAFFRTFDGLEHVHNMVLNKGIQMGLPGMISFLILLGATFKALWPSRTLYLNNPHLWRYTLATATMSVGVYVKNMTDDFFVSHTAFLYWTLVGMTLGAISGHQQKQGNKKFNRIEAF